METMKNMKAIDIVFAVVTLLVLVGGVFCLVMSIMGKGNWYLTAALLLIFVGNLLNFFGRRIKEKKGEK